MKVLYPASHYASRLNDSLLSLKIARHSPCSVCDCSGLYPPRGQEVVLDETPAESSLISLDQYGSDDDDETPAYLLSCGCGHTVNEHGANKSEIGRTEFARRARAAVRIDQLLQDARRLLDFSYTDDDINSLRRQMQQFDPNKSPLQGSITLGQPVNIPSSPTSSVLSDVPPPQKKRRISTSSLSDAEDDDDDDDDEEDRPLASRMTLKTAGDRPTKSSRTSRGQRGGKKGPSMKSKSHTAPTSLAPPTGHEQAVMNGKTKAANNHEAKVKLEDKMDEGQLTRLATGVTVDAAKGSSVPPVKTEKVAYIELRKGVIQITPVDHDQQPRSLVILTGLKTLFQKQLPKMPREYIARLVYDSNSKALAIIKRGYKVVGGICYRPFAHRGFAEIVFFATASVDQVKGYGAMLMDHFKHHIRQTYPDMMYFLTYADNYAVGYFEKQGFSKEITLDRSVWAGYIKDYEGGTIMQCTMLRKVNYLEKADIIAQQREAILTKIRERSKSHIVYPGLHQFQNGAGDDVVVSHTDVPGLKESGWTPDLSTTPLRVIPRNPEHSLMERLLKELQLHPQSWAFLTPVNGDEVADYYDVITSPMDFQTMEHKLETNQYDSLDAFVADAQLVFDNCRKYNPETTIYAKNATKLEKFLKEQLSDRMKKED